LTRGIRGGGFIAGPGFLSAGQWGTSNPTFEPSFVGFRVASIPEPGTGLLQMTALLVLAYLQKRHGALPDQIGLQAT
jgi:hypothetical protein